jgi:hypothetical protein
MDFRRFLSSGTVFLLVAAAAVQVSAAQDSPSGRGRKYRAPLPTSHIEVLVLKNDNQKPVANAAVIFRSIKDGKDEGNLEVKTNEEGKAIIDVIPTGSDVDVQVIANGFATFANTYTVNGPSASMTIKLLRPRAQVSAYVDNQGAASQRAVGVQEPHKAKPPVAPAATPPSGDAPASKSTAAAPQPPPSI